MKKLICYFIGHNLTPVQGNTPELKGTKGQRCDRCRTLFLSAPMPPADEKPFS
jgi:hypothetical protein